MSHFSKVFFRKKWTLWGHALYRRSITGGDSPLPKNLTIWFWKFENFANVNILTIWFRKFENVDPLILEIWKFWQFDFGNVKFDFGNLKILTIWFWKFENFDNLILEMWTLILEIWFWKCEIWFWKCEIWFWRLFSKKRLIHSIINDTVLTELNSTLNTILNEQKYIFHLLFIFPFYPSNHIDWEHINLRQIFYDNKLRHTIFSKSCSTSSLIIFHNEFKNCDKK